MTRVRKATLLILALAVSIAQGTTSSAQESTQKTPAAKPKTQKRKTRPVNRAFLPPEVKEGLPHVLLIGDSISIGYTLGVRKELEGTANVWRPTTNCGPTTKGVEELNAWLGDRKWDVIHFNFGLHDLKYMGPQGQNLADPKAAKSHQQVSIDDYEKNIRAIAEKLKKSAKVVIWRETTPVPKGAKGRVPGDSKKYNDAAARAIASVGGIQTDPMFEFATSIAELQLPANVHYKPDGSQKLAEHVAELIREHLK